MPSTGKLIWEWAGLGTMSSRLRSRSMEWWIVMSGHGEPNLLAIRLGKPGDLTGSPCDRIGRSIAAKRYTRSPLSHDGKLYMLTEDNGMLSCFQRQDRRSLTSSGQQKIPEAIQLQSVACRSGQRQALPGRRGR